MTLKKCIEEVENAKYGKDIKDALVAAFKYIDSAINVDKPTTCPNCGAAITGKTVNCEYCGTLVIWK